MSARPCQPSFLRSCVRVKVKVFFVLCRLVLPFSLPRLRFIWFEFEKLLFWKTVPTSDKRVVWTAWIPDSESVDGEDLFYPDKGSQASISLQNGAVSQTSAQLQSFPDSARIAHLGFLKQGSNASHSLCKWQIYAPRRGLSRARSSCIAAVVALSASTTAATTEAVTPLKDLPLCPYVNKDGRIQPPVDPDTAATIFAVIDNNNRVQYIGFSKDIRNSLRTLIGRRPELCHFYKVFHLPVLDQQKMLAVRQQWVNELGSIPRGNADITQRNLWEQPVDAGSISDRGKAAAAADRAKTLKQILFDKGVLEEMVYNPDLLAEGKCDILPSKDQTPEELAAAAKAREEESSKRVACSVKTPDDREITFDVYYESKFVTNGGWMYDILVTHDNKETRHRVIMGRIYPEAAKMDEDRFLETVMAFLLDKKIPRHTDGVRSPLTFPINYFAVGQVEQRWDEEFQSWFSEPLPTDHWNFKRIHSYGPTIDTDLELGPEDIVLPKAAE
ncbi:hypothetical protein SELMODRAFT_410819 [Selaginella moellendorffii]|uniref:GIY-YIG domain-containing protein n=1 Tax=Selaginella moellendorffii TaxID=88036 RepID=D8RFZ0_SELML|nr:hypothetical protein SELMODRAFT_410819 [Selaginella moellendorffii]